MLDVGLLHVETFSRSGVGLRFVEIDGVGGDSVAVVPAGNAFVVIVNTCSWLTSFTADGGEMLMFASTNRLTALPEFPDDPFVSRWSETLSTVRSAAACPVTVPALADVNVTVKWPLASVVPVSDAGVALSLAPLASVRVTVTEAPEAATKPLPSFFVTVTVNVWFELTSFTPFGAIEMRASTTVADSLSAPQALLTLLVFGKSPP